MLLVGCAISQDRYDSGPFKGFAVGDSTGDFLEVPKSFRVSAIQGSVTVLAAGNPLAGALFQVRDIAGRVSSATTDAKGRFEIKGLRPGRYTFMATAKGFHSALGTVIVSKKLKRNSILNIELHVGT